MKFLSPIKRHSGLLVKITQRYADPANVAWYKANGMNIPFHNGLDLILDGTPSQNYGTELVACFDGKVVRRYFESPMSSKGNGLVLESNPVEEEGKLRIYQAVYWHCSKLSEKNEFKKGETVAYIGNSGLVRPAPTNECVHCGSHLHFMIYVYEFQNGLWVKLYSNNGVEGAVDPLPFIDGLQGESGDDTPFENDAPAYQYFIDLLVEKLKKIAEQINVR